MPSLAIRTKLPIFIMPEVLLLLVAIVWGSSYGLTKSALTYTTVSMFIAIRFGWTFLLLAPLLAKDILKRKSPDWSIGLPTGVILALVFFFEVYGVSQTTASNAAFLISLNVIFTAFVDVLVGKRKPDRQLIFLSVLCTSGVLMLSYDRQFQLTFNQGDIFILCAAGLRAIMVTMTQKLAHGKQITNTTLTCVQSFVVAMGAMLISVTSLEMSVGLLPSSVDFWLITAFLVLFCTLFAFYVQNYAVRKISPTKASLLMGSEPLFGALFSMFWLQETFTSLQWAGAALLLASVLHASVRKQG
ncbi:DMT family transporter [Vibrio mytili]|uniref:DMT family transporter n=1 Tax=Vibrio mytili TaxID=50718 RepID=UPI003C6FF0A7